MKSILYILIFLPFVAFSQTQIGDDINGEAPLDQSGVSIDLSSDGNIMAIGAIRNDGNGEDSGHVRVYENQGGDWIQVGDDIDGEAAGDISGEVSISSNGNIVAVGARRNDVNGENSGHVRVYENQGGDWIQVGDDIDGQEGDYSGISISLSSDGNIIAIGAVAIGNDVLNPGYVRVYENQGGDWMQVGNIIIGETSGDSSGNGIDLSSDGNIIAIGARGNDGNGIGSGHVRIYENQGGNWIQIGDDIDGEAAGDLSGEVSISSNGNIVAVGAFRNDGNGEDSGHVRVYENQGGDWIQVGDDIDGEAAGDFSGLSISLSSDGSIIAIGAPGNDGNGENSGHVRIYENQGGDWMQVGDDINGEAAGDLAGYIDLSSDGTILAIGGIGNDDNGVSSGHVRVFDLNDILSTEDVTDVSFKIYPNPASTKITIQLEGSIGFERASIYTSLGQLIKTSDTNIIDTSYLTQGVYFIKVTTSKGVASQKLIINN